MAFWKVHRVHLELISANITSPLSLKGLWKVFIVPDNNKTGAGTTI